MSDDYARGFRDGVEAAAKVVEADPPGGDPEWRTARIADAIRALSPPSPEPATRRYPGSCVDSGHDFRTEEADGSRECVRCGKPAPAPGPERCGHERRKMDERSRLCCRDCGAEWRDDGQGWRKP